MPKISIIIPVYNVEAYLIECLKSISAQTFTDWECLLIDDGSPDNSGAICDKYAAKDERFKVFHKPNGGVSSARNLGLDNASGGWVTFIDADDFITPTFIEGLLAPISQGEQLDFVHGGCTNWVAGKEAELNHSYSSYIGEDPIKLINNIVGYIVTKLFRLDIIKNKLLKFDEKIKFAEDMAFTLDYILAVKRYAFVSETGYYYRRDNLTSATNKRKISYLELRHTSQHIYNSALAYIHSKKLSESSVTQRLAQVADLQFETILNLYRIYVPKVQRLHTLKKDWTGTHTSCLKHLKKGKIKNFLAKLIFYKQFHLFDIIASTIMTQKYRNQK